MNKRRIIILFALVLSFTAVAAQETIFPAKFTAPAEAYGQHAATDGKERVVLRLSVADGSVQFIVEDTGIGIPATEAERIFDEFVQLNEYYDGTGIGLTVARSLSRRLGGDIQLDTTYTDGARFVMTLPVS